MTRAYALLCSIAFLLVSVVGLIIVIGGSAAVRHAGQAEGNLGSLTLHLTWAREVADIVLLALFGFIWLFAEGRTGRIVMAVIGVVLLAAGIVGTIHGDNAAASRPIAGLDFPMMINIFDIAIGVFGVLASLGPTTDS